MNNVISYCLFEPLVMHAHRTWDPNRLDSQRYWYNIPSLLIANSILYPKFETVFYVSHSTQYHPQFNILKCSNARIEIIDKEFQKTSEPMLWRMFPCWDSDVDCFFTRDVDSLPNREEVQCTHFFTENDQYHIQTIRSHENHYHEQGCDMLGGLSGFKPKKIPNLPQSFDDYYANRSNLPWAQDQLLMVNTFIYSQESEYTRNHFLDCPINNQSRPAMFPCKQIKKSDLIGVELNEQQEMVLSLIEDMKLSTWAGEPCDARGRFMELMLETDNDVAKNIREFL